MVGGESAGGGLCAAVCIRARDEGAVSVAFQMPLYPMLDDRDTASSRDNHGRVWNTRRNHLAWRLYLRGTDRASLSPYAAPARLTDFSGLPPAYSFVGDGEPFYAETVRYFEQLRAAGIPAELDVYHTDLHAFDMLEPSAALSGEAAGKFHAHFAAAQARFFAPQSGQKLELIAFLPQAGQSQPEPAGAAGLDCSNIGATAPLVIFITPPIAPSVTPSPAISPRALPPPFEPIWPRPAA